MRKLIKGFGLSTMFVFSVIMMITFFDAYISPSKTTRVFVNFFGEAYVELLVLIFLAVVQTIAFIMVIKEIKRKS